MYERVRTKLRIKMVMKNISRSYFRCDTTIRWHVHLKIRREINETFQKMKRLARKTDTDTGQSITLLEDK